ncbi:MAG: septum formation initiator family protein [Desulfobacterales bacterium]|nr:septum formation initiator family protein [Desulfobacterales bacterium]
MSSKKKKFWATLVIIICIVGPIVAWLGFGERGLVRLYHIQKEHEKYIERNRELAEENQALLEEIQRLRTDMKYVESVAKRELDLIKDNEVIYRFSTEESPDDTAKAVLETPMGGKSEREVEEDERNGE